jgi:hypothetical protein
MKWSVLLVLLALPLITLPCICLAFDTDIFIKEASPLLGKTYKEISLKIRLNKSDKKTRDGTMFYKASNTGLKAENDCKDIDFHFKGNKLIAILCNTTEDVVGEAVDKAYKDYAGKGGGVGTGSYFWCVYGRGLEMAAVGFMNYIAVQESCPAGFLRDPHLN